MPSLLRTLLSAHTAIASSHRSTQELAEQDKHGGHHQTVVVRSQRPLQSSSLKQPHQKIQASRQLLPGFLGLGLSLLGSHAIATPTAPGILQQTPPGMATPASHRDLLSIDQPTVPSNAISLPLPSSLAQGSSAPSNAMDPEAEAIEGDSEARIPSSNKGNIYQPIRLKSGVLTEDTLTTKDIPMGQGSFARDYIVTLKAQDQVAIDLSSDNFDTVVTLMGENGTTLGENDDGPDGGTNSLLFMRITEDGDYVVRVRGFGQAKGGPFKLKLTRLKAAN